MSGELEINNFKNMGGSAVLIVGKVKSGNVLEGDVGKTYKGKKCAVIKIEKNGTRIPRAGEDESISLWIKYIVPADIAIGESLFF
jgi:sulfate adenylyltransferase subunit 1 (EFTu-like GTPase family)